MTSKQRPIVAELGRPETPAETAERKAATTRAYRSSQTVRNLVTALLATLIVVAVIYFAVPRGVPTERPEIDVQSIATSLETSRGEPVLVPDVPAGWRVNDARVGQGGTWEVLLVPPEQGFIRIAQLFDSAVGNASARLSGSAPTGETEIDGRAWDLFQIRDPASAANISFAMGTQLGENYILLYGAMSQSATEEFAESLSAKLSALEGGS